ncbi:MULTISPECIES: hypothetical protein [unclassified Wolbachia]|uniref:hypothetical protein n=1 Tax=unclassified Wolbachia TaxID=2640676 RepID=UPI00221ECD54|nr:MULTISPECIES: hypothetical protein [unclassified Wolbachia]
MSNISFLRDIDSIRMKLNSECLERAKMLHANQDEELLELMCMEQAELMSAKLGCIEYNNTELEKFECLTEQENRLQELWLVKKRCL